MKNNMSPLRGHIAMKPHLFNFLTSILHLDKEQALTLPGKSSYAKYLDMLLCDKKALRDDPRHQVGEAFSSMLFFQLSAAKSQTSDIFLSPTRIMRFNTFVHEKMHELLFEMIAINHDEGIRELETINLFMMRYKLFEHVSFDALKRAASRYRSRHELPRLSKKGQEKMMDLV